MIFYIYIILIGVHKKEFNMILVRFVFQAKFGQAGNVIEGFKKDLEMMKEALGQDVKVRLLTDLSGNFDTVVQEMELESLAVWEELRAKIFSNPDFQEVQETRENPFLGGRTEFYTIEADF
jgi:hypothetical protein